MGKNKKKQELLEQMNTSEVHIQIDHLYKQLEANQNKEQFVEEFSLYLSKIQKGN